MMKQDHNSKLKVFANNDEVSQKSPGRLLDLNQNQQKFSNNLYEKLENELITFKEMILIRIEEEKQKIIKTFQTYENLSQQNVQIIDQELKSTINNSQIQINDCIWRIKNQLQQLEQQFLKIITKYDQQLTSQSSNILSKQSSLFHQKNNENINQQALLQDKENNLSQIQFLKQCQAHNYEIITIRSIDQYQYDLLILHNNIRFYCNIKGILAEKVIQTQDINFYAQGKLYRVKYDKNFNPDFEQIEGKMFISLQNRSFLLNGQGRIFEGNSNNVKCSGQFIQGSLINNQEQLNTYSQIYNKGQQNTSPPKNPFKIQQQINAVNQIEYNDCQDQSNLISQFKLISQNKQRYDGSNNQTIESRHLDQNSIRKNYSNEKNTSLDIYQARINSNNLNSRNVWYKYNQQINKNAELNLRNQSKGWLTSNVIDSYALYLNIEGEELYFNYNCHDRSNIERVLFFPSSFITSFGYEFDINKAKDLFYAELIQYKEINFEIKKVYSKVGFPINKNNVHWQFIIFDLINNSIELYDSYLKQYLKNADELLTKIIKILGQLLYIDNFTIKLSQYSGQQTDGYSCGYQICTYMKYCYEKQFYKNTQYVYNEKEMKNILFQIISE